MENYFDSEIKRTEQELTNLKTSVQKFAGEVPLVQKSIDISIPLSIDSSLVPEASGKQVFKLTTPKASIFVPTLEHYYDDATKSEDFPRTTRYMYFIIGRIAENQYLIEVFAYGTQWTEDSDAEVIKRGGSVTLTNTLTVKSTDEFTLEVA